MSTKETARKALDQVRAAVNAELDAMQARIGDQDGDGDVDLIDAKLFAQKKIGPWTLRDSKVLGAGLVLGLIICKLATYLPRLFS